MLRTPVTLRPVPRGEGERSDLCEMRDNAGRVLGTGFTPLEGSEALLRLNIHIELVAALRRMLEWESVIMDALGGKPSPDVENARDVLAKTGAM